MCKFQTLSRSVCRGLAFPQLSGWCHFILFSQLAATFTIAKINKKVLNRVHKSWQKWELQFMDAGRTRPFCSERWRLALALCQLSQRHRYLKPILNWHLGIDASASVIKLKSQIPFFVRLAKSAWHISPQEVLDVTILT